MAFTTGLRRLSAGAIALAGMIVAATTAAETQNAADAADRPAPRADLRVWRDVAYGPDPAQRFDVYAPRQAQRARP